MKHTTTPRSRLAKLLSVSLAGSAFMLQPAMASMPDTHIFKNAAEIPDEALAGMRGRYVDSGQVIYFGVQMVTQWQTSDGRMLNSGVNLSVDSQFQPTITIVTQSTAPSIDTTSTASAVQGNVTISGGLGNVSGVAQSIQIGGDGNTIRNDLDMNITLNATEANAYAADSNGIALNGAGTTTIAENGATTTFTLSDNSLSMSVESGQDQVLQKLQGGTIGSTGFQQSTRVGSDLNQIHNTITINAALSGGSVSGMSGSGIQSSLDSLRGLRAAGAL